MGTIGMIISTAVGVAVSVASSLHAAREQEKMARAQGEAQQAMANYNAQVAEDTAIVANQTAKMETKAAEEQTERQRRENKRLRATQLATQMKTGGTATGSALLVEEDQLAEMKLQELDILHQGELRAREHRLQGMQADASAVGSRFQGQQAMAMADYRGRQMMAAGHRSAAASMIAPNTGGLFGSTRQTPQQNYGNYSYASNPGGSTSYNYKQKPKGSVYGS